MPRRLPLLVLLLLTASLLTGCLTPEQRMIVKVEHFMAADRYDDALGYLDTYLSKHDKSLAGWRYRVLIRLDQEDRAKAAGEYASLSAALERHEPDVLREVVLGAGGRWLLSDYRALARCAPEGVVDAAFFADRVEPKHLGTNSLTKVAISADEIGAVLDALPGALPSGQTWAVVAKFEDDTDPRIRGRVVRACGRHLAAGGLSQQATGQAIEILRQAALSSDPELREGALLATLNLPEGPGQGDFVGHLVTALAVSGDGPRAASLFLLGPGMRGPGEWTPEQLSAWRSSPNSSPGSNQQQGSGSGSNLQQGSNQKPLLLASSKDNAASTAPTAANSNSKSPANSNSNSKSPANSNSDSTVECSVCEKVMTAAIAVTKNADPAAAAALCTTGCVTAVKTVEGSSINPVFDAIEEECAPLCTAAAGFIGGKVPTGGNAAQGACHAVFSQC